MQEDQDSWKSQNCQHSYGLYSYPRQNPRDYALNRLFSKSEQDIEEAERIAEQDKLYGTGSRRRNEVKYYLTLDFRI